MPNRKLEEIFYFDQTGINRLYNQINSEMADSITKEIGSSSEYSGGIKPEASSGSIWEKIMPGLKIALELAHKRSKDIKTVETHTITVEQRYIYLIDYLTKSRELRRGLREGWLSALAQGGNAFCLFDAEFKPEPVPSGDWILEANERKSLIVTDLSHQYRMGMGFSNINDTYSGRLNHTSHTAIRIRNGAKMRVLGSIEKSKYIKPYVASWI